MTSSFASAFPTLPPLPVLLSQLSHCEPFSNIIPSISQRSAYIRALIWLLRHSIVEKQRTYVRIVASEEIKRESQARWSGKTRKSSTAGLSVDETSSSSVLSTSVGGTSDHSLTGGFNQRGVVNDAFHPRSRQTSVRPELDDTKGMEIKLSGTIGSPGNTGEAFLSKSASSVLSVRALRMAKKTPTSFGSGNGRPRPSTVSDHSEEQRGDEKGSGPSIIVEPGRPSMYESRWLSEMCKGKDTATVDRFEKW